MFLDRYKNNINTYTVAFNAHLMLSINMQTVIYKTLKTKVKGRK